VITLNYYVSFVMGVFDWPITNFFGTVGNSKNCPCMLLSTHSLNKSLVTWVVGNSNGLQDSYYSENLVKMPSRLVLGPLVLGS